MHLTEWAKALIESGSRAIFQISPRKCRFRRRSPSEAKVWDSSRDADFPLPINRLSWTRIELRGETKLFFEMFYKGTVAVQGSMTCGPLSKTNPLSFPLTYIAYRDKLKRRRRNCDFAIAHDTRASGHRQLAKLDASQRPPII